MNEYMKKIDLNTVEGYHAKKNAKSKNEFIDLLLKEGYTLVSPYINKRTRVDLICPKGHLWEGVFPDNLKGGTRCFHCHKENMKEHAKNNPMFVRENMEKAVKKSSENRTAKAKTEFLKLLEKEGYKLKSKYEGSDKYVILECCNGHIWDTIRPDGFKNGGNRCPHCNTSSHGEEFAKKLLEQHGIHYEREKKFEKLIGLGGGSLRFDFYLPEQNVVIEINGEGHYAKYTGDFFNGKTIEHDKIKRDFCKQQEIKFYDIEYLSTIVGRDNALKNVEEKVLEIIKEITE